MRFFTEMRVGAKLILGFLVVALISAVIGGLGIRSLSQVNGMADIMYEYETRGVRYTGEANTRLVMIGRDKYSALFHSFAFSSANYKKCRASGS